MTWDYPVLLTTAVSLPVIVLLHLLARRRKTLTVPSLMLWKRLLENERRSVTFRRLVADLLLILQLLAAALLVLTLGGPRPARAVGRISGPTVLALDVSAGMSAVGDGGRTRFDIAVDEAMEMVRKKSAGAEVMILAGGSAVLPMTGFTSSRSDLLLSLKTMEPTDEPGNPRILLRTAEAMASARPGGRVVFITDGSFDRGPAGAVSAGGDRAGGLTEIVTVGSEAEVENTGITVFAVRGFSGGGRELLVTVENFGSKTRQVRLSVLVDNRELLREPLQLTPGGRETRTISWYDPLAGRVSAGIKGEGPDALASDDTAYAVLSPVGRIRAALITPGNWFLETLLAAHPNLSLKIYHGVDTWREDDGPWDVVIADRLFPTVDPGVPLLVIYPFTESARPPLPLLPQGIIEGADPVSWNSSHPVIRDVDFSRVSIRTAASLTTGPGVRILAESSNGPLVMAGEDEQRRWVALSFNLLESSLPLRPAFPILISGVLSWLVPGDPEDAADYLRTGEGWSLPPEFTGYEWEVFGPGGRDFIGNADEAAGVERLDKVGFWTAWSEGSKAETGVNLLNAGESDLRPRWKPEPDPEPAGPGPVSPALKRNSGPLTALLLILVLLSISAEWGLQSRYWRNV